MNEKEQLNTLRDIHFDEAKEAEDFEQFLRRGQQKFFHWQISLVVVGIMCIMVFLLFLKPEQHRSQITANDEREIAKVLSVSGDNIPSSSWQMGVNVTKDTETLRRFNEMFENLQPVNQVVGTKNQMRTLKIFYNDGTSELWQDLSIEDTTAFYSVEKKQYYSLPEQYWFLKFNYSEESFLSRYWIIGFIFLISFLQRYLYKKIRDTSENIDQEDRHSTIWQTVNRVLTLIIIGVLVYQIALLHFGMIVLIAFVSLLIDIWLENHYGKNSWRKWSLLCEMFNTIAIFYLLFANLTIF